MKEIVPGVYWPSRLWVSNCYVIRDRLKTYLVDTGVCFERYRILRTLKQIPGPLNAIFLTHSHADHAGNARFFGEKFGAKVFCSEKELTFLLGVEHMKPRVYEGIVLMSRFIGYWDKILGQPVYPEAKNFEISEDFQKAFEFIPIYGHTRGSGAIFHRPTKSLFLGDSLLNCDPLKISMPPGLRFPYECFSENLEDAKTNLAILKQVDFKHAFFGHGPPLVDHAKERILKFLNQEGI